MCVGYNGIIPNVENRGQNKAKIPRAIWALGIKKLRPLNFFLWPNLFFVISFLHQVLK